jgi:hypothetical protein
MGKIHKMIHVDNSVLAPEDQTSVKTIECTSEKPRSVIGLPKIYDLKGNLLASEENLVVLTGREFLAQKLADLAVSGNDLTTYKLRYFGIGSGGTDGVSPNTVGPFDNDTTLGNSVNFTAEASAINNPIDDYKFIAGGQLKRIQSDGSININTEEHTINTSTGQVQINKYTAITFNIIIQENEPADKPFKFNEAAIYAVKYVDDGSGNMIPTDDKILFARFTTMDKFLDTKDGISIEWSVLV